MGKQPRTFREKIILDYSVLQFQQWYYTID